MNTDTIVLQALYPGYTGKERFEIITSLENMFDFSQPTIDHDIIRKFVSKIVPDGKTHFIWYMNLDGNDDTSLDMVVDGRKNHAVVSFDEGGDKPFLHNGEIISINDLQNAVENDINTSYKASQDKKSYVVSILHRLL